MKRLAETYAQRRKKTEEDQFQEVVLHGETLVFITTEIVATVAEVESDSTFRETYLETYQTDESFFILNFYSFLSCLLLFPRFVRFLSLKML